MYGPHHQALRTPYDLDALLLNDQVQRTLSPTAIRNQSGGVGDFTIATHSPIKEFAGATPQTFGFAMQAIATAPPSESLPPLDDSPYNDGIAIRVGR